MFLSVSKFKTIGMLSNVVHGQVQKSQQKQIAISRKVVGKNVHATIAKGNMGYDQYNVPDTVAVEPTFVAFP